MKRPWMPLYIADYLADTTHLMATESGAYLHLLMHYWTSGPIPDDDSRLCRIAKVWPPHWKRIRSSLEPFFDLTKRPGLWSHHRADLEISKVVEISNKRRVAAQQMLSKRPANAEQVLTHSHLHLESKKDNTQEVASEKKEEVKAYAFESGVIRLSQKDFDSWKASFSYLDLRAELEGAREWAEKLGPKWFYPISKLLAKKNREAKLRLDAGPVEEPKFKYASGIPGVI